MLKPLTFSVCRCDCGKERTVRNSSLVHGETRSCGCIGANKTHGLAKSPTWNVWARMKGRCLNVASPDYKDYGGRGIAVCDKWMAFEGFFEDMGIRPEGMSIDRIDNNRGYFKDNCRWASAGVQAGNKRTSIKLTIGGISGCLATLARRSEVKYMTIYMRLAAGWDAERAFTEPARKRICSGK